MNDEMVKMAIAPVRSKSQDDLRLELAQQPDNLIDRFTGRDNRGLAVHVVKEVEAGQVAVRNRKRGDQGAKPLAQFISEIRAQIDSKVVSE